MSRVNCICPKILDETHRMLHIEHDYGGRFPKGKFLSILLELETLEGIMIFSVSPKSSLSWSEEKGQIFEAKLSRKRSSINYLKKNRDHRKSLMLLESAGFFHGQRINC
jgi:hypothetical protein